MNGCVVCVCERVVGGGVGGGVTCPAGPDPEDADRPTLRPPAVLFAGSYDVLGVERNATQDVLRHAFRTLCLRWHPDKQTQKVRAARGPLACRTDCDGGLTCGWGDWSLEGREEMRAHMEITAPTA